MQTKNLLYTYIYKYRLFLFRKCNLEFLYIYFTEKKDEILMIINKYIYVYKKKNIIYQIKFSFISFR